MIGILTSSLGGFYKVDGRRIPTAFSEQNGLADQLRTRWKENAKVLFFPASPETPEKNDAIRDCLKMSFALSGLSVSALDLCDARNRKLAEECGGYDVVILGGGHVPTQNQFYKEIRLKQSLANFQGLLIAWSAGSMNCAETVYALPEEEGEGVDPNYRRFLPGLGITKRMIIPHYQDTKNDVVDGLRVMEDMAYPDSFGRAFYALPDGSYILSADGQEAVYGEAYRIQNGIVRKINEENKILTL